jgi:polyhydroxyalkanoate synthesis regulator phasin
MAAPANGLREQAEKLLLAAVGAVALTTERIDELGDELASKAGIRREEATALVREVADGWRREAGRLGERTNDAAQRLVKELGLVTQDEVEDLELRLAQLEHRLKLLEKRPQ